MKTNVYSWNYYHNIKLNIIKYSMQSESKMKMAEKKYAT